jgi:hypothetical protein
MRAVKGILRPMGKTQLREELLARSQALLEHWEASEEICQRRKLS